MGAKILKGQVASRGMALGHAVLLPTFEAIVPRREVGEEELPAEQDRFEAALQSSGHQLRTILDQSDLPEEHRAIFEAQIMLLDDPMIVQETKDRMKSMGINAEWALAGVLDQLKDLLEQTNDPVIRDRVSDLEDVGNRIISNLLGVHHDDVRIPFIRNLPEGSILVAETLSPSLMLQMGPGIAGIVTEKGGVTGHTAILARARGLPALVGVERAMERIPADTEVLVNAYEGFVAAPPGEEELVAFHEFRRMLGSDDEESCARSPVSTKDGVSVRLWSNLDTGDGAMDARLSEIEGVGLFRTEFLYIKDPHILDHPDEQTALYAAILSNLSDKTVTFRLIDIGEDKTLHAPLYRYAVAETSQHLRGIRFLLANEGLLRMQLSAILEAAQQERTDPSRCRIMVPMVTRMEEIRRVRRILAELRNEIALRTGKEVPDLSVGIMVETPAACVMADHFAAESDFFSLGTNDLAQYTLAIKRTETQTDEDHFYQPALYRMIRMVIERSTIPVSICGELAGMSEFIPLLLGLGIRDLSASLASLIGTQRTVQACEISRCKELARLVLEADDAGRVRELLERFASESGV